MFKMKIAIYGQTLSPDSIGVLSNLFNLLKDRQVNVFLYKPFYEYLIREYSLQLENIGSFTEEDGLPDDVSYLFSLGGDGTFLKSFLVARNESIPLVGINLGHLGFLSEISRTEVESALNDILSGNILIDERTVLQLEIASGDKKRIYYALNEIAVTKLDSSSMINIHAFVNDELLNIYWADGLIVATPTGSTAYSLSVGGPILTPDAANVVISPIAPHNLTVRPVVVPDHHAITLKVEGRGKHFLVSIDSKSEPIFFSETLKIQKASFKVKTIRLKHHNFFLTLRNKLMWGVDKRN
jgi:NAD+ kinase